MTCGLRITQRNGTQTTVPLNVDGRIEVTDRSAVVSAITNTPDAVPPGGQFPITKRAGTLVPVKFTCTPGVADPVLIALVEGVSTSGANRTQAPPEVVRGSP